MKILGYAALSAGQPLQPFSYEMPPLEPFEILVQVTHCGLCHTDIHMINNDWNRSEYPLLPGHEIVGTVAQKGSSVALPLGMRIGVGWVRSACLQCPCCLRGETNICPVKKGCYNKGAYGGFADHVIADSRFVSFLPEEIDSAHAAPLLCAGATVYAPLQRFAPKRLAVLGIGGLGHLALQFARACGCEVAALSSSATKKAEAHRFGAHHFFSLDRLPPPQQFDLILCTSPQDLNWNSILALLKPNGTLCFVSRPRSEASIDLSQLVSTQRQIAGSNNASRALTNEMLEFAARHKIAPQIEEMPLSQINHAIERLKKNEVRYRIVLQNSC